MHDARGNPVGTASSAALVHAEKALWRMASFFDAPLRDIDAAIAEDPQWMLPHVMRASFLLTLTEPATLADAKAALVQAEALSRGATERERAHLAAARCCAEGDWAGACTHWDAILEDHPRDLYALQWAHLFDFYRGDAHNLRYRVERVLPAWPTDDPLRPYLLGMRAFGLEECGLYTEAEAAGREATSGSVKVPWATHAVAHVMEMQGRFEDGMQWLQQRSADWSQRNGFAIHHWWHLGLFHLEALDTAAALSVYDAQLSSEHAVITLNRLDGAALLWRLHLLGVDVGSRWRDVATGWDLSAASAGHSTFNDVHALLVQLGQGQVAEAERRVAAALAQTKAAQAHEVGVPLMQGLLAFARGDFAAATRLMAPRRMQVQRIGGSHAQRDLIAQTLLAAALREAGHDIAARDLAKQLLAERQTARRLTPLTCHWVAQLN